MSAKKKFKPAPPTAGVKIGHAVLRREEDAQTLYRELQKIAESLGVDDVMLLDKHRVYDVVESDPQHPMRGLGYDWDDASAARKQRVEWTGRLIAGLRVIPLAGPAKKIDAQPVYYYADNVVTPTGEFRRGHVHRDQLSKNDPVFVSTVNQQIKQLRYVAARLGHALAANAARRATWPAPWDLHAEVMRAIEAFDGAGVTDHAAEE